MFIPTFNNLLQDLIATVTPCIAEDYLLLLTVPSCLFWNFLPYLRDFRASGRQGRVPSGFLLVSGHWY